METDLNLRRDLMGRRRRISIRRSSLWAMVSAERDGGVELEMAAIAAAFGRVLVLLLKNILKDLIDETETSGRV